MARILKNHVELTLQQALGRYYRLILGVAFLMNLVTMIVYLIGMNSYSDSMQQVLSLNEYYVKFDEVNAELSSYMSTGEPETKNRVNEGMKELWKTIRKVRDIGVSQEFQRDISDAEHMMERYGEKVRVIIDQISANKNGISSEAYERLMVIYDEAADLYERIDAEYKILHLQLLSFTHLRQEAFMQKSRMYYCAFLTVLVLLVLYGSMWGRRLSRWIVSPILVLTHRAEEIRDGKLFEFQEIHFQKSFYKELEVLVHVFNMMAVKIREQIQIIEEDAKIKVALRENEVEKLKIQTLLRTSELKGLQMQMNPHFLFNTLNMISKTAYMENAQKTIFLLQKTAQMLRYSLDYMGKSVSLGREIENLGNYVYLQEERFGKRIQFLFDLDEQYHQVEIPCLILQPLVENSILHGMGVSLEGGRITIRTRGDRETGKVVISILDNGAGMDEETLETVRKNMHSDEEQREKLGLANVYRRLEIFFGDRMSMEVRSNMQEGTVIQILVPLEEKRR